MHILILPSSYPNPDQPFGGVFVRDQVQALNRAGIQVGVLACRPLSADLIREGRIGRRHGLIRERDDRAPVYWGHGVVGGLGSSGDALRSLRLWSDRAFDVYAREQGLPDLIHAHGAYPAGILARHIQTTRGMRYVLTEHSSAYASGKLNPAHRDGIGEAFRDADARIAVSAGLGMRLNRLFGDRFPLWSVAPNLVNRLFEISRDRSLEGGGRFTFLNIAGANILKKQDVLLEAFASASRELPEVHLRIGGDGPRRKDLENLAQRLNLSSRVRFLGELTRERVVQEMQRCHAFVLTSAYETFGVVLIEALACGKPVIAVASDGPRDIVRPEDGILLEEAGVDAVAGAMIRMHQDVLKYDPETIRRDCLARFGEAKVTASLLRVYAGVCEGRR